MAKYGDGYAEAAHILKRCHTRLVEHGDYHVNGVSDLVPVALPSPRKRWRWALAWLRFLGTASRDG